MAHVVRCNGNDPGSSLKRDPIGATMMEGSSRNYVSGVIVDGREGYTDSLHAGFKIISRGLLCPFCF